MNPGQSIFRPRRGDNIEIALFAFDLKINPPMRYIQSWRGTRYSALGSYDGGVEK
jgi:hypothetical protein